MKKTYKACEGLDESKYYVYEFLDKERTLLKCKGCGKPIKIYNNQIKRIYCSKKCYPLGQKKLTISRAKERLNNWSKKHPERFKKLMKENYKRNKPKWIIRQVSNLYKDEFLATRGNKCENCGSRSNLQIHHLKYTLNFADWQVLCKNCHHLITKISRRCKMLKRSISLL